MKALKGRANLAPHSAKECNVRRPGGPTGTLLCSFSLIEYNQSMSHTCTRFIAGAWAMLLFIASTAWSEPFRIYFSPGHGISWAEWGMTKQLVETGPGPINVFALDVSGGHIYWAEYGATPESRRIRRANLDDGQCISDIVSTGADGATSLAVDSLAGKLYWTASHSVFRADLSGGNVEELVSQQSGYVGSVAVDHSAGKFYWLWLVALNDSRVRRANFVLAEGQTPADRTDIEDPIVSPFGIGEFVIDRDGGFIYWYEGGPGFPVPSRLMQARMDGSSPTVLTSQFSGASLQLDPAGAIYYSARCPQGQLNQGIERFDLVRQTSETVRCFAYPEIGPDRIALRIFPIKPCTGADMNGDGHVDGSDIEKFVAKLLCSP